jgi:hemerythrin superfamily protein
MTEQDRKDKYEAMRAVGFNSFEANKLKDRTWDKVKQYIEYRKAYNKYMNDLIERTGRKKKDKSYEEKLDEYYDIVEDEFESEEEQYYRQTMQKED